MKDTDQIAAELANDLFGTDYAPSELRKIKAAIEKATEERDTWWRERTSSERVLRLEKELESRAARASEPAQPAIIGGRRECPECGEDYSMACIHECAARASEQEQT